MFRWTKPAIILVLWLGLTTLADTYGVEKTAAYVFLFVAAVLIYHYVVSRYIEPRLPISRG